MIDDDFDFYDNENNELDYDEPDDACLAPADGRSPSLMEDISSCKNDEQTSPLENI